VTERVLEACTDTSPLLTSLLLVYGAVLGALTAVVGPEVGTAQTLYHGHPCHPTDTRMYASVDVRVCERHRVCVRETERKKEGSCIVARTSAPPGGAC
jgi:hypothetical protein